MKKQSIYWIFIAFLLVMNVLQILNSNKMALQNSDLSRKVESLQYSKLLIENYKTAFFNNLSLQTINLNKNEKLISKMGEATTIETIIGSRPRLIVFFNQFGCVDCKINNLKTISLLLENKEIEDYIVIGNFELLTAFNFKVHEIGFKTEYAYNSNMSFTIDNNSIELLLFVLDDDYTIKCPFEIIENSNLDIINYFSLIKKIL